MKKQTEPTNGKQPTKHQKEWRGGLRISRVTTPDASARLSRAIGILLLAAENTSTDSKPSVSAERAEKKAPEPQDGSNDEISGKP